MNNMGTMIRYELRKILCRRITVIALIAMSLLIAGINVGEYVAGSRQVNKDENKLVGRKIDDELLDEMRGAVEPQVATMEDGTQMAIGISVKDRVYEPLMEYLRTIGGNFDKAYNMNEESLKTRFTGLIDENLRAQRLNERETAYWQERLEDYSWPLTYGEIQNAWGDSVTILYTVALLGMIAIAATSSGVFSDEIQLRTAPLIFSTRNGKKRLVTAKFLAGLIVGLLETLIILLVCVGTEFAISGFSGGEASVQFFVGPTAMDMPISRAFWICAGIMLVIGLLLSAFSMCLSQLFRNSIAVIAAMMGLWLISMLNPPYSWRLISQISSYMPVTFIGSWTFADYRLIGLFGRLFTILQAAPVIYLLAAALMGVVTKISYGRYQVTK